MSRLSIVLAVTEKADYLHDSVVAVVSACMDCDESAELIVVTPTTCAPKATAAITHISDLQVCTVDTNSLAALNNAGRAAASGSRILFLREGILLSASELRELLHALDQNADIGGVGPFSNRTGFEWQYLNAERLAVDGLTPSTEMKHFCPESMNSLFLENFALLVQSDAFDRAGGFCEDFPAVGGEDIDLSFRLKCMGYRLLRVPVYLPHADASVYCVCDMARSYARPILLNKWGLDIGLPESLWQEALMAIDWRQDPALIHATCRSVLLRAPLVSIFLMTYNRPEYFRAALESALAQTYPNIEIIVGDFGTDDRTQQLVQGYLADRRIRYVRGAVSPREEHNKIFNPLAEFFQWLMDDDILLPDKLTLMVDAFLRHPNVTLVTSQRGVIDADGHYTGLWGIPIPLRGSYELLSGADVGRAVLTKGVNFLGEPSIVLYKRMSAVQFPKTPEERGYDALGDIVAWLSFLEHGDCAIFTRPLGLFRRHANQESKNAANYISAILEWKRLMDEYRGGCFLTEEDYHMGLQMLKEQCLQFEPASHRVEPNLRRAFEECYRTVME